MTEVGISGEIAIESVDLPPELHPDPADRLLVATARLEGMRLATRDARLLAYGGGGHVNVTRI
jgi:PIN domain nuclease of toxin-antitoxin system